MMKTILLPIFGLFGFLCLGQGGYNNMTNHQLGNYVVEPSVRIGENNKGLSLTAGYFISDYALIRAGATYRKYEYKNYTEDILEGNIDFLYTVYSPRYDDPFFHKFNLSLLVGVAYENVKTTSEATFIEPYPKYIYINTGANLEFTLSDHVGIVGNFKQYYAVNGSKDKLGNWRYDYGIGLRYYLWGR